MSSQDKQVRITIAVDEASAAKAKRSIADLVVEVNRLVQATEKVNLGFGGSGGGMGARVGAMGAQPGTSAATQATHKVASAGGGLAENLARAVQGSATLFRGAAEGSKGAFDVMTKALKRHVDESEREIQRLTRVMSAYEKVLGQVHSAGIKGSVVGDLESRYYGATQAVQKARAGGRAMAGAEFEMLGNDPSFGGGAAPGYAGYQVGPGRLARMRAGLNGFFAKGGAGGGLIGGALGTAGLGFLAGAGGFAALAGTASYLAQNQKAYEVGNLNYALDRPMFTGTKEATYGRIFGGQANAIRGGDLARVHAIRSLSSDADFKTLLGSQYKDFLVRKATMDNPEGGVDALRSGRFKEYFGQRTGRGMDKLMTAVGLSNTGGTGETKMEIDREKALAFIQTTQPEKFQQMIENRIQSDPRYAQSVNGVYSGAGGLVGLADASRTSGGFRRDKQGNALSNTTNDFMFRSLKSMWDPSQVAGMMGSLAPTMGWKLSGEGIAKQMLSMTTGGFGSAPGVAGAGSQYGGKNGMNGLLSAFQRRIGGGGLDISAGSNIGSLVANAMMSGSFGSAGGGQGLAETLLTAAASGGGGGGGDMRMARMVQSGFGANDRMMSGGIDPLQKGLNAAAALKVAPGSPYITHNALMGMDSATALDILKTGKVGSVLAGSGITRDLVGKYVAAQDKSAFSRVTASMLRPEQASELAKYREHGGLFKGANLSLLAGALSLGTGDSPEAAFGRLQIQAARQGLLRDPRGSGAHRAASSKSLSALALRGQGVQAKVEGMNQAVNEGSMKGDLAGQNDSAQNLDNMGNSARVAASGTTEAAVEGINAAFMQFLSAFRREARGGRAGAPRGSAQ